jgi:hypothetical protein
MTKQENTIVLSISFDVDQNSDNLFWELKKPDSSSSTDESTSQYGVGAGAIQFFQGENVMLEVKGGGISSDGFTSFQIMECCLITRPKVLIAGKDVPTRYASPSPFLQSIGSSYVFENDYFSDLSDKDDYRTITQMWKHSLNIEHTNGVWELSLNLTVRIRRGFGLPDIRVFRFDPEFQVGNGTRPGLGHPVPARFA